MTKRDYNNFKNKVAQLNNLIEIVDSSPEKYNSLIDCKNHDEVVELAREWGYEIGKRWGEY